MKRSIVLVTAALGLAACTSTPAPDSTATSSSTTPPVAQVVTTVVTQTVTNPPAPPAKPVMGSFGYGDLRLGMTRQQALDAKLIGPGDPAAPETGCSLHDIIGTSGKVYVSTKMGVATISFTPEMSSDGVGKGVTVEKLKAEYTNLRPGHNSTFAANADGNQNAYFHFTLDLEGKVGTAALNANGQDCHS